MFRKNNALLEQIQRCLEDYLESKRMIFARFYFLSNDELLEILSQTRNPLAVQPHMRKCFDAIQKLDFGDAKGNSANDILAMISPEGERVAFGKGLKARGNVEVWLGAVEDSMIKSLRALTKAAIGDFLVRPRTEWVRLHASQVPFAFGHDIFSRSLPLSVSPLHMLSLPWVYDTLSPFITVFSNKTSGCFDRQSNLLVSRHCRGSEHRRPATSTERL